MASEDQVLLGRQREEKLRKQELIKAQGLEKAEKKHIEARLWFEKYNSLAWKTPREVNSKLQRVESKTNKIKELKLQINIRVKGLGFD